MPIPLIPTIKQGVKRALSPWRVRMGPGSFVRRPYRVSHPERIQLGQGVMILRGSTLNPIVSYAGVSHGGEIVVGDRTYIGAAVALHAVGRLEIGAECVLSDHIYISDLAHGMEPDGLPMLDQPLVTRGPVRLGRRCFVGYRAVIMPGVTLGDHCVVGANSVVTRSFPAGSVVGGAPARLIRTRDAELAGCPVRVAVESLIAAR